MILLSEGALGHTHPLTHELQLKFLMESDVIL